MLTSCPECGLQVSDKAIMCPHCGYPLKGISAVKRQAAPKRKRLPNGFGQISKISGKNLQKPYRAMVTIGTKENGKPICKILEPVGYFRTYNEAYEALVAYNKDPFQFGNGTTMNDLFNIWIVKRKETSSQSSYNASLFAWNHCDSIKKMSVSKVRPQDLRECIDNENMSSSSRVHIKNTLNHLFDYAIECGITNRNPAKEYTSKLKKTPQKHHIPFSNDEMDVLWSHVGESPIIDMVLIDCYSGWRPGELLSLKLENVNISDKTFTGGSKTDAGKNRTVPIHSKILPLVEKYVASASSHDKKVLFKDVVTNYEAYAKAFGETMLRFGLSVDHKPHDCRVQFVSMLKNADVNEYIVKRLAGHAISDITENVYTHWDTARIAAEVEKI